MKTSQWVGGAMLSVAMAGCAGTDPVETESMQVDAGSGVDSGPVGTMPGTDGGPTTADAGPLPTSEDGGTAPDGKAVEADAGIDAAPACVPHCPSGVTCGVAQDVCGTGPMQCGTCQAPDTCGVVKPGVCGCTPVACVALQTCGSVPNNCGGTENCGGCGAGAACEKNSCVTIVSLGCQMEPSTNPCAAREGSAACVDLIEPGVGSIGYFLCNSASTLPADLCSLNLHGAGAGGGWYDCCTLPGACN